MTRGTYWVWLDGETEEDSICIFSFIGAQDAAILGSGKLYDDSAGEAFGLNKSTRVHTRRVDETEVETWDVNMYHVPKFFASRAKT